MEKVRWGVIGATARAARKFVMPAILQSEYAELVAVASRSLENAQEVCAEFGATAAAYGDYDSLIADGNVEAIYVPLPNSLHLGWAVEAMNNGKHVLCEKPLAMNVIEAEEMVQTAEENGVLLTEAFMYWYHPLRKSIRETIASGEIGVIKKVKASIALVQNQSDDHRWDRSMGGGALFDIGCYCVHIARDTFGHEPLSVTAMSAIDATSGVDTSTTAQLDFGNDQNAVIDCAFSEYYHANCEIIGSDGYITIPKFSPAPSDPAEYQITCTNGESETRYVPAGNMFVAEVDAFSRRIRGEETQVLSPEDAIANMRVLDAIGAASRSGLSTVIEE